MDLFLINNTQGKNFKKDTKRNNNNNNNNNNNSNNNNDDDDDDNDNDDKLCYSDRLTGENSAQHHLQLLTAPQHTITPIQH